MTAKAIKNNLQNLKIVKWNWKSVYPYLQKITKNCNLNCLSLAKNKETLSYK